MMFSKIATAFFVVMAGVSVVPCNAQGMYSVTEISGVADGKFSRAFGINNAGQVVGQFEAEGFNVSRAFLYSNGVVTDLGTLGGDSSAALAINNSGVIVGAAQSQTGMQAFAYTPGLGMTNVSPSGQRTDAIALGVSDSGAIVGSYSDGNYGPWGFAVRNGVYTYSGNAIPVAINASGVVAGKVIAPNDQFNGQAYVVNGQQENVLLKVPGYPSTKATGVNAAGDVIGFVDGVSQAQSFLYSNGKMTLLGSLAGTFSKGVQVYGVNSQDVVVGLAYGEALGYEGFPESVLDSRILGSYMITGSHAVIYRDGKLQDLNDLIDPSLGWELLDARSINDSGQIVGEGLINNQIRAYVLTPVPEPSIASGMLLGLAFLFVGARLKRRTFC